MKPVKIVIIGAGSVSFGTGALRDAIQCEELRGSKLVLVDINRENLDLTTKLAHRMNEEAGAGLLIESTTDRLHALPEADFVITSVAVNRDELWKKDWDIPRKYGIKQVLGENGGPGGLSHAMRNIPKSWKYVVIWKSYARKHGSSISAIRKAELLWPSASTRISRPWDFAMAFPWDVTG